MANRTAEFASLPNKLKDVNKALVELNKICAGTTGPGSFDEAQIWGATADASITTYMNARTVLPDIHDTVQKLLGGLPGSSGVSAAIQAAIDGVQGIITKIQQTASEMTANGSERADAFNRLNNKHSTDPNYNYSPPNTEPLGFIPAIEGVINEAADASVDLDKILGPVKALATLATSAQGIADFTEFAVGTVELLKKALTVS
jgi:uncharacterized protein YukE